MSTFAKTVRIGSKPIISATDTTATTADVLKYKTFITENGQYAEGAIETKNVNDIEITDGPKERKIKIPSGYYDTEITKREDKVNRAETTLTVEADTNAKSLTFTASNNQQTGYVNGGNKTATKTVVLEKNGNKVEASVDTKKIDITIDPGNYLSEMVMTPQEGSVTVNGTNININSTNSQPTSGYYITATGNGKVSATGTARVNIKGYIEAGSKETKLEAQSNTETKYYTISTEEKTVTPSGQTQTIVPTANTLISKITVNPALLQAKTVQIREVEQIVRSDTGQYGLSTVTIPGYHSQLQKINNLIGGGF